MAMRKFTRSNEANRRECSNFLIPWRIPMSPITLSIFAATVVAQLAGVTLLPKTIGFTKPIPSILCAGAFLLAIIALARLSFRGVELGIMIPMTSAIVPLAAIGIGIVFYGESASPFRLSLLAVSCVSVGIAAART